MMKSHLSSRMMKVKPSSSFCAFVSSVSFSHDYRRRCTLFWTEQVIEGLDKAVVTMKKGEVAYITIPPEHAFSSTESKQDLAVVPPNSTVIYEVELVSFVKVCLIWFPLA